MAKYSIGIYIRLSLADIDPLMTVTPEQTLPDRHLRK